MSAGTPAVLDTAARRSFAAGRVPAVALAVLAGGMVAWLSRFGPLPQMAIVLGLGFGAPLLMLFAARPHLALAVYLGVLPAIKSVPLAAGLNGGEMLSLLIMVLGTVTLWVVRERVIATLRRLGPILIPLVALIVVSVVSLLVNQIFVFEEVASALLKFVAFAVIPVLVHVHVRDARRARITLVALLVGAVAVALYALVEYLAGWSYSAEYGWNRPMGTFENWNLLGACMALLALPTLGYAAGRRGARRLLLFVCFALEVVVLLLSLTLGSMLGLIAGAFVLLVLMQPRWSRILPVLLLGALAVGIVYTTNPLLRDKVERFDERLADRLRTYATGAMMVRDRFWWGFGSEQNMAVQILGAEADYSITRFGVSEVVPHNSFLKVSAEKGVFGLLAFTALIVGSLHVMLRDRRRFRGSREAPLYYGILAGMIAFLVQNMTNDLIQHARLGIVFFALLAIIDRLTPADDAGLAATPDAA